MKSNSEKTDDILHKEILDEIHNLYLRKNADYGSSFAKQWNEYGILSLIIRLDDKMNRLKQLSKNEAKVKTETIEDTLIDMCGYCVLGLIEMKKDQAEKA